MPSSVQSVATQVVFDYLLDSQGRPLANRLVTVTLDYSFATNTSPVVFLLPITATAITDNNGYWQLSLVPNATINPSGTVYSVEAAGQAQYQISVPASAGPFQSSAIIANATVTLSPATTGLTGPITVTGDETVTGNLSVQGNTSLAATQVAGDLTIASAFRLLFLAAASKLVPGATSFSIRNNADSADNLLVTNAGAATVRNGLTVTAGGLTVTAGDAVVTAGRLLVSAAAAKILGGATSLSLRNNADSADNLNVTDAGIVTLRNALSIPSSAGGALPTTSYGTLPIKADEQTPSSGTSITIPASGTIPSWVRMVETEIIVRSGVNAGTDDLRLRYNGDTGANYNSCRSVLGATYASSGAQNAQTSVEVAFVAGATSGAGQSQVGTLRTIGLNNGTLLRGCTYVGSRTDSGTLGAIPEISTGNWNTANTPITSFTLFLITGPFVAGCSFVTYYYP